MAAPGDTIAAVATPPGRGGVGIVRVSGPAAGELACAIIGALPPARHAQYGVFRDAAGQALDHGIALWFPGPHSFTGEDVLELQGHGGPVVMDLLLARALELGARLAEPGEFSQRAFLNDRLDLAQAEAVADLIEADSAQAAHAAVRSLAGEFSRRVLALAEALVQLRMYVEAAIDFPEEEIDFLGDPRIAADLAALQSDLACLLDSTRQACLLREGMTVVIAGRPNAGKSSLLNRLAARESAIVTDIPGTTRDVLREHIHLDGMPLHIVDTAGLRESADPVEQEGIRRAWQEIEQADRVLLVTDHAGIAADEQAIITKLPGNLPVTVVRNKIDLAGLAPFEVTDGSLGPELGLSAKTGAGLEQLRTHLKAAMGFQSSAEGAFIARRRHLDALRLAEAHLDEGARQLAQFGAGELLAEELREAHQALGEITGEFTSDELLGRIFSSFCIGK